MKGQNRTFQFDMHNKHILKKLSLAQLLLKVHTGYLNQTLILKSLLYVFYPVYLCLQSFFLSLNPQVIGYMYPGISGDTILHILQLQ